MYECNTGIECEECEKFGGCSSHLEKKCLCEKMILVKEAACPECLIDLDDTMDILDREENKNQRFGSFFSLDKCMDLIFQK